MIDAQRLTLGNNTFTYRVCGSGPDVLLIHGWISSGRMWEALMRELAPHFRVWAVDLVGFGDSRNAEGFHALSINDQAELIVAFCQAQRIVPYAVVGHSMGGAIALTLALDYPDLLEKLVLVSPVVTGRFGWLADQLFGSWFGHTLLSMSRYVWPFARKNLWIGAEAAIPYLKGENRTKLLNGIQKSTWEAAHGGLASMINIRLDRRLHEIRKQVLIITGSLDNVVPPSDSRTAAALIAGAQFLELPHCHHQTPDEDPDCFHQTVYDFLVSR